MAKATLLSPFKFSLLLLLSVFSGAHFHEEKKVLNLLKFQWQLRNGSSSCLYQKSRSKHGAAILEMKDHYHCKEKKVFDLNKKLQKRIILDDLHVRSLQSRIDKIISAKVQDLSEAQIPLASGTRLQTLNYIVTVELGDKNVTVIVDTGSDLTWIQCQPCESCYNQQDPLYDPSISSSYQTVFCNSSTCQSLESATGNPGSCSHNTPVCDYVVNYGDGSYTSGDLGRENLKLGANLVNNFVFGCGRSNKGLFGGASGLMGLGRSDLSLVSQTSATFGGIFSYCLPSTETLASGSLAFGGNSSVYKNSTPISYTRMVLNPQLSTFYFLNLTGITVGGVGIESPSFGKGILIDSGTVVTRLPPSIYKALQAEFLKQFSSFPKAPGFSILDTCFNLTGYQEVNIPTLKLQFEGNAELNVDVTGVFYFVKTDASQVCLALASLSYENEISIIANYQQKNQRVIYDTKASTIGFAQETCSFM